MKELYRYEVLDTSYEDEFNDVVQMAAIFCNTPIALVSLIDQKRQWFKTKLGIEANEFPREISFCGYTINADTLQTLARQVVKLLNQNLLNKQLDQQQEKLQQQMEMQNRILSITAHDVRNPIGAVKPIIELNAKKY